MAASGSPDAGRGGLHPPAGPEPGNAPSGEKGSRTATAPGPGPGAVLGGQGPGAPASGAAGGPSGPRTLTVLGCDGSYPGPGGAGSGYLVQAGGTALWLDAGPGTFANLQRVCDPAIVGAVVLSHEHPDHWTDLESFAVWRRQRGGLPPMPVYAPPGLRRRSYYADDPGLAWVEVAPADREAVGELVCSFAATDHGPPTLAVRIDPVRLATGGSSTAGAGPVAGSAVAAAGRPGTGPVAPAVRSDVLAAGPGTGRVAPAGRSGAATQGPGAGLALLAGRGAEDLSGSLAYSADSGPDWSLEELGHGIGTALCEATYLRDREGELRHLSGRQAGAMAAAAGVGRLVVTHRWPTVSAGALADEADEAFGRPVHQAEVGRVFEW